MLYFCKYTCTQWEIVFLNIVLAKLHSEKKLFFVLLHPDWQLCFSTVDTLPIWPLKYHLKLMIHIFVE